VALHKFQAAPYRCRPLSVHSVDILAGITDGNLWAKITADFVGRLEPTLALEEDVRKRR
jgi:hypothetical protein